MAILVKLFLFFLIAYFVAKTAMNLFRAALEDPKSRDRVSPRSEPFRDPQWQGPRASRSRPPDGDVEDAKWKDLK